MLLRNRNELEARRVAAQAAQAQIERTVLICAGTGCLANGSAKVAEAFRAEFEARGIDMTVKMVVKTTGCHGFCEHGPLVSFQPSGVLYERVKPEMVREIVEKTVVGEEIIEALVYHNPTTHEAVPLYADVPFYAHQTRIALKNIGQIDPGSLDDYLVAGGFSGLAKTLDLPPDEVINAVEQSGLRGRGGGGFPSGRKWRFCAQQQADKKYLVANGDEGDPGAFMDRSLMEGDPFAVIEGMLIAAYAIGSDEGFIYVRHEYPLALTRLGRAIEICHETGLLGKDILGSGFSFDVTICQGGGAFVCGEETALIASLEGRRGMPQPRPPFPAVSGLWGKPTTIHNVETLGNLPSILNRGADWFASYGTASSKGTKTVALVGKINNTGLAEVPMGISLREIVYDIGGGVLGGKQLKGVQTGGPSGGCLPAAMIDLPVDYEALTQAGSIMGSGGLIVLDEDTCVVDLACFFLGFTQQESCGKCTPCRVGTRAMRSLLERITDGSAQAGDLEVLKKLAGTVKNGSLCGLGQTAPNPVLTTLKYFHEEYLAHVERHECPAFVCRNLVQYHIDPERCVGCGMCAHNCPVAAIQGEKKSPHQIDQNLCTHCGACLRTCPGANAAVYRRSGDLIRREAIQEKKHKTTG